MKDTPISNQPTQDKNYQSTTLTRKIPTSIRVDPEVWSRFKEECLKRGVWTCTVLEALMLAWIEGQKATATVIKPVTVNLTLQHVVERPRRKVEEPSVGFSVGCYRLEHRDWLPANIGWCRQAKRWVHLEDCDSCSHIGEKG